MNKKAQVMQNLGGIGIGIASIVILLAVVFLVMAQINTSTVSLGEQCANSSNYWDSTNQTCCTASTNCSIAQGGTQPFSTVWNSTATLTNATATIPGWIPLIVLVVIGGIILAMVSRFGNR